jgi:carbamoyl-phosphate synthase large subunit
MEHLERAGVHSGDSITMYPSQNISDEIRSKVLSYTKKIALEIGIRGMINIQFIEYNNELYIIEVNPRASRTVPYISKVSKVPIVDLATRVMLGQKLVDLGYGVDIYKEPKLVSVKVPVFSTEKLQNVEVSLGPEMRSTGEVLGIGRNIREALYKGFIGAGMYYKFNNKKILATINNHDKKEFLPIAKVLYNLGCKFIATEGTYKLLKEANIEVDMVNKINEEELNIISIIKAKQVDLVINTPTKGNDSKRDGFLVRRASVERNIAVITALDTLKALVEVKAFKIETLDLDVFNIAE